MTEFNDLNTLKEGDEGTWDGVPVRVVSKMEWDDFSTFTFGNLKKNGQLGKKRMTWQKTSTRGWHSSNNTNSGWQRL